MQQEISGASIFKDKMSGEFHIIYECPKDGGFVYFRTTTGAFGQRDMRIIECSQDEAKEILSNANPPTTLNQ